MGSYLNPSTIGFEKSLNSEIYIDKSLLIKETNNVINTRQQFMCVSRPRRFGKSMAMEMLSAYYSCNHDSHPLFDNLKISSDKSYNKHINRYNVIHVNMQSFLSRSAGIDSMLDKLKKYITHDIATAYPDVSFLDPEDFIQVQIDTYAHTGIQFIILIDEWDCLFREYKENPDTQKKYLDFLRSWMKDQDYVALAYMTGILPIKKYGTHSALNMFTEFSMTDPRRLAPYFGFTGEEVRELCRQYNMPFEEVKAWYDGYELSYESSISDASVLSEDGKNISRADSRIICSMYNPKAVVESMLSHQLAPYWNQTETYEALKVYIQMNIDGLKDAVTSMLTGQNINVNIRGFDNDMTSFSNKDDILTLLIHLGYLSYHQKSETVTIPNKEVSEVYITSIERIESWKEVFQALSASKSLLESLWECDGESVAAGVDMVHDEIAILKYNDENSLSCCIHMAFFFAREYYNIFRELPSGKGFADVVYIPRPLHADKPAAVIELKWDKSAHGAIAQIKNRQYCSSLKDYNGNLLLCGINYDSKTKKHTCAIEKIEL